MNIALTRPLTREQFLDWAQSHDGRFEFDGVRPVAITGGNPGHNHITLAIRRVPDRKLAGSACSPLGPDAGVATVGNVVRYPDAVVTCSTFSRSDHLVPEPIVVFEAVSPGSLRLDRVGKLHEDQAMQSIRTHVIVESKPRALTVLSRAKGEIHFRAAGLTEDDLLERPEIGGSMAVREFDTGGAF
jgi:Uma2 family endonuclease